jgi:hypothetical protein
MLLSQRFRKKFHGPADTDVQDRSSCPICKLGRLIMIEVIHPERAMVPDTS